MALRSREIEEPDDDEAETLRETLAREEEIGQLRAELATLGIPEEAITRVERSVGRDELAGYLEDLRDQHTLGGRLRRATLQ